jgi:hypothetical protein
LRLAEVASRSARNVNIGRRRPLRSLFAYCVPPGFPIAQGGFRNAICGN